MHLTALSALLLLSPVAAVPLPVRQGAGSADAAGRGSGLTVRMFQLDVAELRELPVLAPGQTPNRDVRVGTLDLATADFEGLTAPMTTRVLGWLRVADAGAYVLRVTSDDGSRLTLDGEPVIDHDGRHGAVPKESAPLGLAVGLHELLIEHFDSGGARALRLDWKRPGATDFERVPESALLTEDDPTRVTSPGVKAVIDERKPGTGLPLAGVHPSWRVETLRPAGFAPKVGALCFLPDGRLAIGTFDPLQRDERELPDIESKAADTIYALDVESLALERIASDVYEPSGLCVVEGALYVAHRRAIERLVDADGDGFFETHQTVGAGWEGWNYHQFVFGLEHRDGKLYATLSTTMAPPGWEGMDTNSGPSGPLRGGVLEVDLSSGDARVIAGGTRTPNGIGQLSDGTLVYLDNQGTWMPTSQLSEVVPGAFYGHYNWTRFVPKLAERFPDGGHPSIFSDRPRRAPALWLPQNEVVNSPTQPVRMRSPIDAATGQALYPGEQILLGDVTAGGVRRAQLERVGGVLQGALFRFSQGFEAGINRMTWGPDGALYVGGMGAGGNWNWQGTQFGLQRLVPTGAVTFELAGVSARTDGFEIAFTQPVGAGWLERLENFRAASWTYVPTAAYGGPKVDVREHAILAATPAADRRSVRLAVDGLTEGRCVHLALEAESATGAPLWSGEAWYTLNAIPSGAGAALEPLAEATYLMPRGVPVQFWQGGPQPPAANRTQDQLMEGPGYFELDRGSEPIESSVVFGRATIELEYWAPASAGPLAALGSVQLGDASIGLFAPDRGRSSDAGSWQRLRIEPSPFDSKPSAGPWGPAYRVHRNGVRDTGPSEREGARSPTAEERASLERSWDLPRRLRIEHAGDSGPLRVRNVAIEAPAASGFRAGAWVDLLADSSRWTALGGNAAYTIEDGVLIGETRPNTPNTFLVSRDTYADFELLYEFHVHPELNSGVQIRSEVVGSFEQRGSALRGYQVEIDPSPRSWTAGLYEERGRGWIHPLIGAPYARRAFRQGAWNRVRVLAEGPRLRTWINGVPAADAIDTRAADGHIGFQVHGVGGREDPLQVRWRKVRLRRLTR